MRAGAVLYIRPQDEEQVYNALRYIANENARVKLKNSAAILHAYADVLKEQMHNDAEG